MRTYFHRRQIGRVVLILLSCQIVLLIGFIIAFWADRAVVVALSAALLLFILITLAFSSLTIEVNDQRIRAWFGPGWIWREIRLSEIVGMSAVTNRWYWGWGVRLTPYGWMFNISGMQAVEVELVSGKRFRFGTDQPRNLVSALRAAVRDHGDRV